MREPSFSEPSLCIPDNPLPSVPLKPLLDRSELIEILEQHLAVTDEWGGCKLASWQYGYNVMVDGIDEAVDAILSLLSNKIKHSS